MHLDSLVSLQVLSGSSECSEPSLQPGVDGGEDGCEQGWALMNRSQQAVKEHSACRLIYFASHSVKLHYSTSFKVWSAKDSKFII